MNTRPRQTSARFALAGARTSGDRGLRVVVAVIALGISCESQRDELGTLARGDDGSAAILVLRERDCDSNLQAFDVFNQPEVDRHLPLAGVVALDSSPNVPWIRTELRSYDIRAPLLQVSTQTREALRRAARNRSLTVLLLRNGRVEGFIAPATSASDLPRFVHDVTHAARPAADGRFR